MIKNKVKEILEEKETKEEVKDVENKTSEVEEDPGIIYKSKLLNKEFEDLAELKKAESEYKLELAKKEEARLARKEDADLVQDAYVAKNKATVNYNDAYAKAVSVRKEAIDKINKEFYDAIRDAKQEYEDAAKKYSDALTAFQAKHPEGYHLTLKDGNNELTISKHSSTDMFKQLSDQMQDAINLFNKFWFNN